MSVWLILLVLVLAAVSWNLFERYKKEPYLATFIGNTLSALYGYSVYQITYTDLTVYVTKDDLFATNIFGKKFRLIPINATAITFGEVVIVSTKNCNGWCVDAVLKHEFVHVDQYREMGSLKFFSMYLYYFIKNFVLSLWTCIKEKQDNCWNRALYTAYEDIPMEVEAREKSGY